MWGNHVESQIEEAKHAGPKKGDTDEARNSRVRMAFSRVLTDPDAPEEVAVQGRFRDPAKR